MTECNFFNHRSKLNSIEGLINNDISHEDFMTIINEEN